MRVQRAIALGIRYWYIKRFPGKGFVYVHHLKSCYIITRSHSFCMERGLVIGKQHQFPSIRSINEALEDL